MRTLLVVDAEGVCSGVGEGEADSSGMGEGVGVGVTDGDSCASTAYVDASESRIARFSFFVILLVAALCERRINSAAVIDRHYIKCNTASLRSEKGYRAIRNRAEIFHRHDSR